MVKRLKILLVLSVFLVACEKKIDNFNPGIDMEPKLIVEGYITTDRKAHTVRLSNSVNFYETGFPVKETEAEVTIVNSKGTYELTEVEAGVYETDNTVRGEANDWHMLHIKTKDGEEYEARAFLQNIDVEELDFSVKYEFVDDPGSVFFHNKYKIFIAFKDPIDENYYSVKLYANDELVTPLLDPERGEVVFEDKYFNGQTEANDYYLTFMIDKEFLEAGDLIRVEMRSVSKPFFDFVSDANLEVNFSGSPMSAFPSNISTNVNNNGWGVFYAASDAAYVEFVLE